MGGHLHVLARANRSLQKCFQYEMGRTDGRGENGRNSRWPEDEGNKKSTVITKRKPVEELPGIEYSENR